MRTTTTIIFLGLHCTNYTVCGAIRLLSHSFPKCPSHFTTATVLPPPPSLLQSLHKRRVPLLEAKLLYCPGHNRSPVCNGSDSTSALLFCPKYMVEKEGDTARASRDTELYATLAPQGTDCTTDLVFFGIYISNKSLKR